MTQNKYAAINRQDERLLDQIMTRSSRLMNRLNDSWFECRKCNDGVVPSESK